MVLLLDLQDFLLRARVLKLYRQALRVAGRAPEHARGKIFNLEEFFIRLLLCRVHYQHESFCKIVFSSFFHFDVLSVDQNQENLL